MMKFKEIIRDLTNEIFELEISIEQAEFELKQLKNRKAEKTERREWLKKYTESIKK